METGNRQGKKKISGRPTSEMKVWNEKNNNIPSEKRKHMKNKKRRLISRKRSEK